MSRIWSRISGLFRNRTFMGADKAGNQYYVRTEQIDGIMKERRWVEFKAEDDPTSIPVEWICWLNGQRKKAPTPEEMAMLEARRQRVKENVARLKKEEEERRAREGAGHKIASMGKGHGPDLRSFMQQLPVASEGDKIGEASETAGSKRGSEKQTEEQIPDTDQEPQSSEPTGSGGSFRPGTWQPPT